MIKLLMGPILLLSISGFAIADEFQLGGIQRTFNGVKFSLKADWDTAIGECALRGYKYGASDYYSYGDQNSSVAFLNKNGTVKELITVDTNVSYSILSGVNCH
ncbi:MAG: hypothetical protein Q7U04_01155 [Bacteriovorax sp.]|nr:hypothetical protein [Bacteriovorax sp.]